MKYFSTKGQPLMRTPYETEFAGDFFETEATYAITEILGGTVAKRIVETTSGEPKI